MASNAYTWSTSGNSRSDQTTFTTPLTLQLNVVFQEAVGRDLLPSSAATTTCSSHTSAQMAALQRLIILLMAICTVLSVGAVPLQVRQQSLQALIPSDDSFSDVMATTLL